MRQERERPFTKVMSKLLGPYSIKNFVKLKYCTIVFLSMITVNCRDVSSIKSSLAVYTSDKVGAVPALKKHEFVLVPIDDEEVNPSDVIKEIKIFLASLGCERHFAVIRKNNLISVVSIDDYKLESPQQRTSDQFFSCIHCGHVTSYETVHNNHMKIHYL